MFTFYLSMLDTEEQKDKFEDLYLTYRKLMFYIANKILKDDFLAEDAVHQTFIKIIEIIDKLEDVHGYKTKSYIVTMIKNQSIVNEKLEKSHRRKVTESSLLIQRYKQINAIETLLYKDFQRKQDNTRVLQQTFRKWQVG